MLDCPSCSLSSSSSSSFCCDFDDINIEELQAISLDDFLHTLPSWSHEDEYELSEYSDLNHDLECLDMILKELYLEEMEQNECELKQEALNEWKNVDSELKDDQTLHKQFEEHTKSILEHIQQRSSSFCSTNSSNLAQQNKQNQNENNQTRHKPRISYKDYLKSKINKQTKPMDIDLIQLNKLILKEHDYCLIRKELKISEIECVLKEEAKQALNHARCRQSVRQVKSDTRVIDMDISPERCVKTPQVTSVNMDFVESHLPFKRTLKRLRNVRNTNVTKSSKKPRMASLYVNNIEKCCKKTELKNKFSRFGEVAFVKLNSKGLKRNHAVIKYKHKDSARRAFEWIEYHNENAYDHEFSDLEVKYGKNQMKKMHQVKQLSNINLNSMYQDFDQSECTNEQQDEDWFTIKSNFIEFDFLLEKARMHLSKIKK